MEIIEKPTDTDHEKVVIAREVASGYRGIIAIHSTVLGPAVGGTRFWNYASEEEAITDALRLSRGMTYKNALPGLPLGGGKSIIIGDNGTPNREALFRANQAATKFRWNRNELSGLTVAVQGCGHVGYHLVKMLYEAGANLTVTD